MISQRFGDRNIAWFLARATLMKGKMRGPDRTAADLQYPAQEREQVCVVPVGVCKYQLARSM